MSSNAPTSAQTRAMPLPKKFKCRICDKFKDLSCYSKKELGNVTWRLANRYTVGAVDAKLRCRSCTGENRTELQCNGPCGLWRSIDDFSKSARTAGGSKWCNDCSLWKEAAEPGITVAPAPQADLAPDEDGDGNAVQAPTTLRVVADPEAGYDTDDENVLPFTDPWSSSATGSRPPPPPVDPRARAPAALPQPVAFQRFANLSLQNTDDTSVGGGVSGGLSSNIAQASTVPPHLRPVSNTNNGNASVMAVNTDVTPASASPSGSVNATTEPVASNDRSDMRSQSSVSNPYETESVTSEMSTPQWGRSDVRRVRRPPQLFLGVDNQGNSHLQRRNPETGSIAPVSSDNGSGRTALPNNSRNRSSQEPQRSPEPEVNTGKSGWAKPVGSRNANRWNSPRSPE